MVIWDFEVVYGQWIYDLRANMPFSQKSFYFYHFYSIGLVNKTVIFDYIEQALPEIVGDKKMDGQWRENRRYRWYYNDIPFMLFCTRSKNRKMHLWIIELFYLSGCAWKYADKNDPENITDKWWKRLFFGRPFVFNSA